MKRKILVSIVITILLCKNIFIPLLDKTITNTQELFLLVRIQSKLENLKKINNNETCPPVKHPSLHKIKNVLFTNFNKNNCTILKENTTIKELNLAYIEYSLQGKYSNIADALIHIAALPLPITYESICFEIIDNQLVTHCLITTIFQEENV